MKTKSILGFLTCLALVFSLSFAQSANAASAEEEVLQVLETSVKALNTSDSSLLSSVWSHSPKVSMFGPDKASLFLTQGWTELDKSNKTLTNTPVGTYNFTIHHPQVTMLGDNSAITTAYLTLVYTDSSTKAQDISQARMTLVYQRVDGKWLVVHNHSSMFPTE